MPSGLPGCGAPGCGATGAGAWTPPGVAPAGARRPLARSPPRRAAELTLGRTLRWYVDARLERFHADAPASRRYAPLVERIEGMDAEEWRAFVPRIAEVDGELSGAACAAGELHYALKYGATMGVRSDWFLAEQAGTEWYTAAAPVREEDIELLGAGR